jgi:hypothetical protein
VPLSARVLANGTPVSGSTVLYKLVKASATLTSATVASDPNGYANTTLHISGIDGDVQVSACFQPANQPCRPFSATAVPASVLNLQPVGGSQQVITAGQQFRPVVVRVSDSATPPHVVLGGNVKFQSVTSVLEPDTASDSHWRSCRFSKSRAGDYFLLECFCPVCCRRTRLASAFDQWGSKRDVQVQGTAAVGTKTLLFLLESLR